MNLHSDVPFTQAGCDAVLKLVFAMPQFLAMGLEARRSDTELGNFMVFNEGADLEQQPRKPYVSLRWMVNQIEQLFPLEELPHGDRVVSVIVTHTVMNQGRPDPVASYAVREAHDTALPWLIMRYGWAERESTLADPLAMEYLADHVANLILMYVQLLEHMAREQGLSEIGEDFALSRDVKAITFQGPPHTHSAWPSEAEGQTQRLLAAYANPRFEDVTASTGIPQRAYIEDGSLTETGKNPIVQRYLGSGLAVGEFDNDGLVDLFLSGGDNNRLKPLAGKPPYSQRAQP